MIAVRLLVALLAASSLLASSPSARAAGPCSDLEDPASAKLTEDDAQILLGAKLSRGEDGQWNKSLSYGASTPATPEEIQGGLTAVCDARQEAIRSLRDKLGRAAAPDSQTIEKCRSLRGQDAKLDKACQQALQRRAEDRLSSGVPLSKDEEKDLFDGMTAEQRNGVKAKAREKQAKEALDQQRKAADRFKGMNLGLGEAPKPQTQATAPAPAANNGCDKFLARDCLSTPTMHGCAANRKLCGW